MVYGNKFLNNNIWAVWGNLTSIRVLTRKTTRLTIILWRQAVANIFVGQIQLIYSQKNMKAHCDLTSQKYDQVSVMEEIDPTVSIISMIR